MKRIGIVLLLLSLVAAAAFGDNSVFYPVRVDVVKIFAHGQGLRVLYRKGVNGLADVYIPAAWFVPGGKAELVRADDDPSFPYMTVFYKEGKFSHLRLYAKASANHDTWGVLPPDQGAGKFDVEEIKLQF